MFLELYSDSSLVLVFNVLDTFIAFTDLRAPLSNCYSLSKVGLGRNKV